MANPDGTPIWYELMTSDPDGAAQFYKSVIGWTVSPPQSVGEIDYRMISIGEAFAGGILALTDDMTTAGARPGWLFYLGVSDVDQTVERLQAAGGSVIKPAWDLPGIGRMAFVSDPQGVPFYVMRGATEGAESHVFSPTDAGRCSWNELATTDMPSALAFYGALFQIKNAGSMPMGDMGDYVFLAHHENQFGAVMTRPPQGPRPGWTFYFRVADVDAATQAVSAGGGKVRHGPVEVPGGQRVAVVNDPQGAIFGLVAAQA